MITMQVKTNVNIPSKNSWSYPIIIEDSILNFVASFIEDYAKTRKVVIIADDITSLLYGERLLSQLHSYDYQAKLIAFESGEANKSSQTKELIETQMFDFGADRHTLCIALGGGVVGDIAGFVAATYMRGIKFIQVPTSLLAMIDSSVGGKVAVNTSYGKNIIGAFWQPQAVLVDLDVLKTLSKEHVINGFFEAIKIFLTFDKDFVLFSNEHMREIISLDTRCLMNVIKRAVELKAHVVEVDEFEQNLRMVLNFGHTVGHALEKLTEYKLLHGYAVAYGMLVEAKISNILGYLSYEDFEMIKSILLKLEIFGNYLSDFNSSDIVDVMRGDKKNVNQQIKLVLLSGIGSVYSLDNEFAFPVDENIIIQAVNELKVI